MIEIAAALSIAMMHLSRLSEELILWSSQEFQFVDLPDAFCTGSSMMPQKKNPDVPELVRGKTGRVYGHLISLLTTMKALPLSYNRDFKKTSRPYLTRLIPYWFRLQVLTELMRRIKVNREALKQAVQGSLLLATELADYLVTKGVPFREAHAITGRVVRASLDRGQELTCVFAGGTSPFSDRIDKGLFARLTVEAAIDRKGQVGSTARGRVEQRIKELERGYHEMAVARLRGGDLGVLRGHGTAGSSGGCRRGSHNRTAEGTRRTRRATTGSRRRATDNGTAGPRCRPTAVTAGRHALKCELERTH